MYFPFQTLAEVNGQRAKLSSVEQLLNHLLYLEPVFDGDSVRGDMQQLTSEYQRVSGGRGGKGRRYVWGREMGYREAVFISEQNSNEIYSL